VRYLRIRQSGTFAGDGLFLHIYQYGGLARKANLTYNSDRLTLRCQGVSMKKNEVFMKLLRRKDLTQEQFAELVESAWSGISGRPLSRQAVSAWVNGKSIPKLSPAETLVIIEILGCTLTEFALAFPHEHTESEVLSK
jgi:hypothetical protein